MAEQIFTFDTEIDNDSLDVGAVTDTSPNEFSFSGETDNNTFDVDELADTSTAAFTLASQTDNDSLDVTEEEVSPESFSLYIDDHNYSDVLDGYYYGGIFYSNAAHTKVLPTRGNCLYVDIPNNLSYRWAGSAFVLCPAQGGGGTGDKTYNHLQGTPSAEWIITHNLGKYPSVSCTNGNGIGMIGDVEYISTNQLKVSFSGSCSGYAYLN